jgi:hypothetical protein
MTPADLLVGKTTKQKLVIDGARDVPRALFDRGTRLARALAEVGLRRGLSVGDVVSFQLPSCHKPFLCSGMRLRRLLLQADSANMSTHRASPVSKRGSLARMILVA